MDKSLQGKKPKWNQGEEIGNEYLPIVALIKASEVDSGLDSLSVEFGRFGSVQVCLNDYTTYLAKRECVQQLDIGAQTGWG